MSKPASDTPGAPISMPPLPPKPAAAPFANPHQQHEGKDAEGIRKMKPSPTLNTMSPILVNTFDYNSCSAGVRVMHYLAALLRSADIPVAVTSPCFYDPTIPVRAQALPDDIVVYPDATRGNGIGANRICRYMLYYAHAYFGGDRIAKDECAIVYHHNYLADVQAHCDSPLTEEDVITIPILDSEWCFPEAKTIENVLYAGKGRDKALPLMDCMLVPAANAPENSGAPYADHYAHMRTLAMLRKAKNFYTLDPHTLMSCEAALCGCKVFYARDDNTFEEQSDIVEESRKQVMSPERDVALARKLADKIYRFFETRTVAQPALGPSRPIPTDTGAPAFTPQKKRAEPGRLAHAQAGSPKIKVGVLSLDPDRTACAYLRLVAPLNYLHAQGRIEYLPLCEAQNGRITLNQKNFQQVQLIVIQRTMPICMPFQVLRAAIKNPAARIVFELDDALTLVPGSHPACGQFQLIRPQIEDYLRNADLVTVSTPQLKEVYSSYNDHIEVLPNTVDPQLWLPLPPKAPQKTKVTILFAGTLTHQNDLALIEPAIERIIQEFGDRVEFLFWGNLPASLHNRPRIKSIAEFTPDYRQYVERMKTLPVDLALVPLEVTPFNRTKSDIKWLEYSACKIPAIFSDLEPYNQSVVHGKTGWLAANTVEVWHGAIKTLILDDGLRQAIAENAHQTVLASRSLEANADLWVQAYEKALALPPKTAFHERPVISIIIPTFNKIELTRRCLQTISAHTPAPAHEIIVVDNGSTDGTPDFLRAEETAGRLRAILNPENTGFAKACNQGARAARGHYIVFLNNDTEVQSNWLGALFALAEADPAVAAVGGKLLYPDGTIQHAGVALADCWDHDPLLAFHLFAKEKADFPLANQRRVYQAVTAACMLARKSHFDQVGGFDEEFWNGYEDVDLCLRFQERGWLAVYEPASVVIHYESQSGPERFRRAAENVVRFHRKWLEKATPDVIIDQGGKSQVCQSSTLRLYAPPPGKLVSIILLAHNQLRDTQQCLASIEKHTPQAHELILVDNGSTDGTTQYFRQYAARRENVRVIFNRANLGFSAGNNQGLACAKGDAILLLNNDTVVTPGWLERLLAAFDLYPDCGLVGPVSNSVSGPQLVSAANYSSLEQLPKFAAQWNAAHAGQSLETARLVGFCLMLRRAVLDKVGGLDPQFGTGNFEDDDLCIRAGLAGFKLRVVLDSFVHHTGGQTFKGAKIDYRASMLRNWELFKTKWGLAQDAPLELGYRLPSTAPAGLALRVAPPDLSRTHASAFEGRCWIDKTLPQAVIKKSPRKPAALSLPPCALAGQLGPARDLLRRKQLPAAWEAAAAALLSRPYHPEAYLLLGEIALAAGHGDAARLCARHARELAPGWAPPKQFLKNPPRGNARPQWLKLPPALDNPPAAPAAPRLSVCLIAKNEEKFLGACLKSVRALAWQIIVVDTGSTDRTVEIAREHGAEVYHFPWCDDFSAARNAALEHARGDWVLALDADEELMEGQAEILAREIQAPAVMGYRMPIIDRGREQDGCSYVPRLFRNAPGLFFLGRVHEQAFSSIQVRCQQWGLKHQLGKATLLHHGYTDELVAGRNKIERNLRLLERAIEELPDEPNLLMSLGLELVRSGKIEAGIDRYWEAFHLLSALPPAQVTPELRETLLTQFTSHLMAAKRFSEIVQLWQIPFAQSAGLTASQHFSLGLAYLELQQPAEAAEQMRQCVAKRRRPVLSPINREILKAGPNHCLALCLTKLGEAGAARQAFDAALADDPSARPVRFDFARFHAAQGRPIDALKLLNQLREENPADLLVWHLGGQIALSRPESLEFACNWTGEAVKHFPQNQSLLVQRAEALMLSQDIEQALPLWRDAHAPNSPRQRAALVLCELLAGAPRHQILPAEEPSLSQEAIYWYRQWINVGAHSLLHQLHESMEKIRLVLPGFVRAWEAATRQVRQAAA
ncbi:MAG: glycosyltransferase [Verrucomicrobiota bacterium]|jgi:GT2 family glycosyltransferase/tetratricopeptide (TPR) repeat protein/glycosyltransferase involved in cell wall biosynthesis